MTDFDSRFDDTGQADDRKDDLERVLRAHRPGAASARPEFHAALGRRFTRDVQARMAHAGPARPGWLPHLRSPRLALAAGFVAVLALATTALWVARSPRMPPAMTRTALLERNAAAWADTATLAGSFSTGDGWYFEEWLWRSPTGLMYKRFSRPPATTVQRPQWNVSDGASEWVVDADSRTVRAVRPAARAVSPDAPPQERMQCAALALPPELAAGPAPVPALLDNVPVYRLTGDTADGQPAVFWVDARDYLVRRIDRSSGATVWAREQLELDPYLAADTFRPEALTNL